MASIFRNERDHYGFNTRYESRERTPPGTYGSPVRDRDTRLHDPIRGPRDRDPRDDTHDPWSHERSRDPRDDHPADPRSHDPRDHPLEHSRDHPRDHPTGSGWDDRQSGSLAQEDERYGYSKSYNDERPPYQV